MAKNQITAEYYHVPASTKKFSKEHLEIHKQIFNPTTQPEYFYGFTHMDIGLSEMGIDYDRTILYNTSRINKVKENGHQQKYRHGNNAKYKNIKESIQDIGIDLRKKFIFLVEDNDGNLTDLFSGNTFHDVLSAATDLENRIISIFKKNKNFTISNLIAIGVYFNNLEKPFGEGTPNDLKWALKQIKEAGGFGILSKTATDIEIQNYAVKCRKYISFMLGIKEKDLPERNTNTMINELIDDQLEESALFTVTNFQQVLDFLAEPKNGGYVDSPCVKYLSYGPYGSKLPLKFSIEFLKDMESLAQKGDSDYFDHEQGMYCMVVHGGTPNAVDPVKWFFNTFMPVINEYNKNMIGFLSKHFFQLPEGCEKLMVKPNFKVLGIFQPVRALDSVFPYKTVIPFEEVENYYHNHYIQGASIPSSKLSTISTISFKGEEFSIEELEESTIAA